MSGGDAVNAVMDVVNTAISYDNVTSQGEFKQQQDQENAGLAQLKAADAQQRGNRLVGRLRMQASELAARQRLAYANSGVDTSQGTPVDVASGTGALEELDVQTAMNNAAREAWGFQLQSAQFQQQWAQDAKQTSENQTATLVGGAGKFAGDAAGAASGAMGGGSNIDAAFNSG